MCDVCLVNNCDCLVRKSLFMFSAVFYLCCSILSKPADFCINMPCTRPEISPSLYRPAHACYHGLRVHFKI